MFPLTGLTKANSSNQVDWTDEHDKAFETLKTRLSSEPVLKLPKFDREFILQTDASDKSIGATLLQEYDGMKHPVGFASKKLLPRERNYTVGERECLAVIWGVQKYQRYLYGRHFVLETDHKPLECLNSNHSQNQRITRWSLSLAPYRFTVKYIRGGDNVIADYMSRA
mgnify:FL=1